MSLLSVSPISFPQFLIINRFSSLLSSPKSLISLSNRNNSRHNHRITARALDPEEQISSFASTVSVVVDETKEEGNKEEMEEEEETSVDSESENTVSGELLKKFDDLKLDSDGSYYFLIYGTAAIVAIWLSSAVVGAIDSIPLFPKMMEVVGLVYTIWFSYRYLLFKENRNEFIGKVEELKRQMFGDS